jgi:hypothetical protein
MGMQDGRPKQHSKRPQGIASKPPTNHQPTNNMNTYKIIRFRFNGSNRTIKKGLTLEQAQAHCQDEKTSGEGWFDGYESE